MKKKLKILHIIDHLPNYHHIWGGAEKSASRRIKVLVDLGQNTENIVAATKPIKRVREKFLFLRIVTVEDFFPKRLHLYITGFKNQVFPFDPLAFFHLLWWFWRIKPDVIHLHKANKISFSPILAAWLMRIPLVLSIADYWYFCPVATLIDEEGNLCHRFHGQWCIQCSATQKFGWLPKFGYLFRRPLFDFFLNKINGFLVASISNKRLLSAYGIAPQKLVVVRQVYDPLVVKTRAKIKKNTVYLNAWMAFHKGVHIAVAAMAKVIKEIPEARLYIDTKVFDRKYEQKIIEMIKELDLEKKVFISQKPSLEVYLRHIKEANVVIVPEQWENMGPTTLGDAMTMGKAIVASKIGGIPEIIRNGKNGLLAKPQDPSDFAQKILLILRNPRLASSLGKQAARDITSGARKITLQNLLKLYQTALAKKE
jgi:glycosyltransferase involved in cell wall biosynthesis